MKEVWGRKMGLKEALFLGVVQGLTEFLPVSSSGHLVLFQKILGLKEEVLFFDILVHVGTLLALFAVFARDFWEVVSRPTSRLTLLLVVGTVPTALLGLLFKESFASLYATGKTLGLEFILTGLVLWVAEKAPRGSKGIERMGALEALAVGTMQGLAILPALSRSGLTIAGALLCRLDRKTAARYSFLLSAPAILGAALVELKDLSCGEALAIPLPVLLLGTAAAFLAGYLAVRFMLRVLTRGSLKPFVWYVSLLGALILLDQIFFHRFF